MSIILWCRNPKNQIMLNYKICHMQYLTKIHCSPSCIYAGTLKCTAVLRYDHSMLIFFPAIPSMLISFQQFLQSLTEPKSLVSALAAKARDLERSANPSSQERVRNAIAKVTDKWTRLHSNADDVHVGILASFGVRRCFSGHSFL